MKYRFPQQEQPPKNRNSPSHWFKKTNCCKRTNHERRPAEDYPNKIRAAREKLGLTHEELGKKINEKASVLRNLEAGKMAPNNHLAAKLEHMLKIKLLVPISEEKVTQIPQSANQELTLGELIKLDKKGGGGVHRTKAVIVQRRLNREESSLDELKRLAESAGYSVVATLEQTRPPDARYQIGAGKVEELAQMVQETGAGKVIFDNQLKTRQAYNLAKATRVEVIDRFALILEIFNRPSHNNRSSTSDSTGNSAKRAQAR